MNDCHLNMSPVTILILILKDLANRVTIFIQTLCPIWEFSSHIGNFFNKIGKNIYIFCTGNGSFYGNWIYRQKNPCNHLSTLNRMQLWFLASAFGKEKHLVTQQNKFFLISELGTSTTGRHTVRCPTIPVVTLLLCYM